MVYLGTDLRRDVLVTEELILVDRRSRVPAWYPTDMACGDEDDAREKIARRAVGSDYGDRPEIREATIDLPATQMM